MSKYNRVIPRDLFNEALLLKCLGRFYILQEIEPLGLLIEMQHIGNEFEIRMNENGEIYCQNIEVIIKETGFSLDLNLQFYNKENSWPLLYYIVDDEYEVSDEVFNTKGELNKEFIKDLKEHIKRYS